MRNSLCLVALGGIASALFVACSSDDAPNDGPSTEPSASTTTPVTTGTTTGPSGSTSPTGAGPTGPSGPTSPMPTSTGNTGGPTTTGPTGVTTGPSGGSGTDTSTTSTAPSSNTTTTGPAGTTTTDETGETTEPMGPPEGAYEACSGTPMPAVKLTEFLIAPKVSLPIDMDFPPGQPDMVYVVERGGKLKRFALAEDGSVPGAATTVLEVTASTANECGFLSVAFHPNFDGETEKRFYVSYTPTCPQSILGSGGSSALDEYEMNGDTATKVQSLFEIDQPQGNHNGGNAVFGPDGYLYFGLGDGGNSNDTGSGHSANGNGQDVNEPLGSLLRFDVDAPQTPPDGNLTEADVGQSVDTRILHYGLRNPWRYTFDRVTGDLWIGDVGQDTREEVDMLPAGSGPTNFGWAVREGKGARPNGNYTLVGGTTAYEPIYDYATNSGGGSIFKGSVTGGYVYRGQKIPGMYGRYLFADFVRADIFALAADGNGAACDVVENAINNNQISDQSLASFAEDNAGELYVIGLSDGIFRIDPQ